jgi:hypothetical protein
MDDNVDRLCQAVYGRPPQTRDYLGGSEARILGDAANLILGLRAAGDALAAAAEEAGLVPFALGVGAMTSGLALDPETKALADRQIADARAIADRLDAALAGWAAARGDGGAEATPESEGPP